MKKTNLIIYSLLVLACLLAYWPVFDNEFVSYDDDVYITANEMVKKGLTAEGLDWAFTEGYRSNWHPLTYTTHMLDVSLFGLNPTGHHATNLLLHVLSTLFLFVALNMMTNRPWLSMWVTLFFGIHPMHVESVAWAAERKDVLSGLFWMLTLIAYVRYTRQSNVKRYLLVCIALACGLMSKSMLVTMPCVLLLLDGWPLRRWHFTAAKNTQSFGLGKLMLEKIPLFGLVVASSAVTFMVQRKGGAVGSLNDYSLFIRIENAMLGYLKYLWKCIYPHDMACFYPHTKAALPISQLLMVVVALLAITAICVWLFRKRPWLTIGWFWFLGTLVPVIGIVQVGWQAMADRYSYIPYIGLFIAIVWEVGRWLESRETLAKVSMGIGLMASVLLVLQTRAQVDVWQTSESLYRNALAATEGNWIAHYNLGNYLYERGDHQDAETHFREAIRIDDKYVKAFTNLGAALHKQGRYDEAIPLLERAVELDPRNVNARYNYGAALQKSNKLDQALEQFTEVIRLQPNHGEAMFYAGYLQQTKGKFKEAAALYKKATILKPNDASLLNNLGALYYQLNDYTQSVEYYERALKLDPTHADAKTNLRKAKSRL